MRKTGTIEKMTPGSAIRAFCVNCCADVFAEVKSCDGDGADPAYHACPFHPYRMGRGRPSVRIIRKHCLQCMGETPSLVRECETTDCPCYPYRMGKNPARIGKGYFGDKSRRADASITAVNGAFALQNQRSASGMDNLSSGAAIRHGVVNCR